MSGSLSAVSATGVAAAGAAGGAFAAAGAAPTGAVLGDAVSALVPASIGGIGFVPSGPCVLAAPIVEFSLRSHGDEGLLVADNASRQFGRVLAADLEQAFLHRI